MEFEGQSKAVVQIHISITVFVTPVDDGNREEPHSFKLKTHLF